MLHSMAATVLKVAAKTTSRQPTPNAWTIVNNKLYLNYNLKVKEYWIKETEKRIATADVNWTTLNKE